MNSSDGNYDGPQDEKDHSSQKVQVFRRINHLKLKANVLSDNEKVQISADRIQKAENTIKERSGKYSGEIETILKKLTKTADYLSSTETEDLEKVKKKIFHLANQAKDLAGTFNYPLMEYFAFSLRDFIEGFDHEKAEHLVIINAHINTMWIVFNENIQNDGDEKASELKKIVAKAIQKYG